jgi:hypothetical protein
LDKGALGTAPVDAARQRPHLTNAFVFGLSLDEEAFGWSKTVGSIARTMLRCTERVGAQFTFTRAGYNLPRLPTIACRT